MTSAGSEATCSSRRNLNGGGDGGAAGRDGHVIHRNRDTGHVAQLMDASASGDQSVDGREPGGGGRGPGGGGRGPDQSVDGRGTRAGWKEVGWGREPVSEWECVLQCRSRIDTGISSEAGTSQWAGGNQVGEGEDQSVGGREPGGGGRGPVGGPWARMEGGWVGRAPASECPGVHMLVMKPHRYWNLS